MPTCKNCGAFFNFWSESGLCDRCTERGEGTLGSSGPAREPQTLTQQAVPILGVFAGIGLATAITCLYGFQDRETIQQILLLVLWVLAPMIGAVIGGTLVGLRWLPKGVEPAKFALALVAGTITVVLYGLLFLSLRESSAGAVIRGPPALPTKVWWAIMSFPGFLVCMMIYGVLDYSLRRVRRRK